MSATVAVFGLVLVVVAVAIATIRIAVWFFAPTSVATRACKRASRVTTYRKLEDVSVWKRR
jgi:hypothetical protein